MSANLKLIIETDIHDYDVILEQENSNSPQFFKIRGPYAVANKKNANGRVYDPSVLRESIENYTKDMINTNRAFGELNHPAHTDIDPDRICHRIVKLEQEGDLWIGESIVLSSSADGSIKGTACGDTFASILQHGGKPGMSTRGVGNIEPTGLVNEYNLIAVDAVMNPSGPGCFVDGILESKNFIINTHGDIVEAAYTSLENGLAKLPKHDETAYLTNLLKNFINSI